MYSADRGDLGIGTVDRDAGAFTARSRIRSGPFSIGVEWQDLVRECAEYLISCATQVVLPVTVGEPRDA